jgi:hypothetical protein
MQSVVRNFSLWIHAPLLFYCVGWNGVIVIPEDPARWR